ncbi:hypothetical protein N7492_004083 [Penicillium capsulatum]|uniref:Uncharacterized protein n=1 Tax=Penicillium capsulatum TaxID=69766 RepID=A0A9W9IMI4_9EURO|nr:hypothetical protein N7492_004083 [Penicillium capsulatum]
MELTESSRLLNANTYQDIPGKHSFAPTSKLVGQTPRRWHVNMDPTCRSINLKRPFDIFNPLISSLEGDGVKLNNITIRNWKGTEANGAQRGPIKVKCADGAPCTDFTIEDFAMWTEEGDTETTVSVAPSGYSAATKYNGVGSVDYIRNRLAYPPPPPPPPIPAIPTSFYPGATP